MYRLDPVIYKAFLVYFGTVLHCLAVGFTAQNVEDGLAHKIELFDEFHVIAPVQFYTLLRSGKAVQIGDEFVKITASYYEYGNKNEFNGLVEQILGQIGQSFGRDFETIHKSKNEFHFENEDAEKFKSVLISSSVSRGTAFNHVLVVDLDERALVVHALGGKYPTGTPQAASLFAEETLMSLIMDEKRLRLQPSARSCDKNKAK